MNLKENLICGLIVFCSFSTSPIVAKETSYYKCKIDGKLIFSERPCSKNGEDDLRHVKVPLTEHEKWKKEYDEKRAKETEKNDKIDKQVKIALSKIKLGMSKYHFMTLFEGLHIHSIKTNTTTTNNGIREQA